MNVMYIPLHRHYRSSRMTRYHLARQAERILGRGSMRRRGVSRMVQGRAMAIVEHIGSHECVFRDSVKHINTKHATSRKILTFPMPMDRSLQCIRRQHQTLEQLYLQEVRLAFVQLDSASCHCRY